VVPGMVPNAVPGMMPNAVPGMVPNAVPGMVPNAVPGMVPNAVPGVTAGNAVSSAILYLAIVAIWAVILVPVLVRRSHDGSGTDTNAAGPGAEADAGSGPETAVRADAGALAPGAAQAAGAVYAEGLAREHGVTIEQGVAFEYEASFEYGEVRSGGMPEHEAAADREPAAGHDIIDHDQAAGDPGAGSPDDDITEPVLTVRGRALWSEGPGWHSLRRDRPRPVVTRQAALQARRRMLTMLVTLALVALALTARGLAPLWILVPPFAMLGLLALVLHEAAHADAESAARRAEARAAHRARQARIAARRRAEAARAAAAPEPTAEIIDISARVKDQFYDQYADAAVRAVGD